MQLSTLLPTFFLLFAGSSNVVHAHFRLDYPVSLGFNEDTEPTYPCGGSPIVFADNDTSIPVDSFPIGLLSTHPQGDFSYRVALGQKEPYQWVELLAVTETGLGNFCLPNLKAPASYAGSSGLIQVVGQVGDGTLYQVSIHAIQMKARSSTDLVFFQCASVKFVSGSTTSVDSNTCKNSTVSAVVTSTGNATTSASNSTSSTSSGATTGSAATPTKSGSASSGLLGNALVVGIGAAFIGGLAAF